MASSEPVKKSSRAGCSEGRPEHSDRSVYRLYVRIASNARPSIRLEQSIQSQVLSARAPAPDMKKASAGLLLYRDLAGTLQVMLVHPGGPYWARKDIGAWSIPKGEIEPGEEALAAARREFQEETGGVASGEFLRLHPVRLRSGKVIHAWAVRADFDPSQLRSNLFSMEWPPKSGQQREFPEADRAGWFGIDEARLKIHPGQAPLLDELLALLAVAAGSESPERLAGPGPELDR